MNPQKKSALSFFALLTIMLCCFIPALSRANTNPSQTISGEVSANGTASIDLEKEVNNSDPNWWVETFGPWGDDNFFKFDGKKLYVTWDKSIEANYNSTLDGEEAYIAVDFDEDGNVTNTQYGWVRGIGYGTGNANFCVGDDSACKFMSYATLHVKNPRTLTCSFNCDQKNKYNYSINYQAKKDGHFVTADSQKAYKCEEIKGNFTPNSEWFGNLVHSCAYRGGEDRIYTIDTISPATDLISCSDQATCLSSGTEFSLTPTTFGKGVQKISSNFVESVQNSINAGTDTTVKCSSGLCTPYSSGLRKVSLDIPETTYYGQCRGVAQEETVGEKVITSPEISINTGEVKIPNAKSDFDFNVVNRAPVVSVTLSNDNIATSDEVTATCDIIDPDFCSDKIVKVKWTCVNDKKEQVACYFGQDGIWHEGTASEEIPAEKQENQYRSIVKFKASAKGTYAITCEGTDNDLASSATGVGGVGISVGGDEGVVPAMMKYCSVLSEEGSTSKTVCGESAKVNLKTFQFGIDPISYEWKCDKTQQFVAGTDTKECSYENGGTFVPGLRILDKKSNSWVDCTSENNTVKVTNNAKCAVLVRLNGSNGEYSSSLKASAGDKIDAEIKSECTKEGDKTEWNTNGTQTNNDNSKSTILFSTAGSGYVKANIGSTVCTGANIDVTDNVKMGN